jgi:hypothetical protein
VNSKDSGNIPGEEASDAAGDRKLVEIRFSRRLKPDCGAIVGPQTNEAEARCGV